MTTRALATKLKRLEKLAKMHPGWHDAEDSSPPVALPSVEEFRVLSLEEQKRLLSAWRPPPSERGATSSRGVGEVACPGEDTPDGGGDGAARPALRRLLRQIAY
jgi:hypothetical protein